MPAAHYVLIVDDEESICWGLQRLLTEEGHEVAVASSAEEGLESAAARRPDLLVLDVRLPGMDGLTAMERFHEVAGPLPIIVITAFGNLETAVTALKNGAIDYLTKPFDLERATSVLRRALANARFTLEAQASAAAQRPVYDLLGSSPAMQRVFKEIAIVAPSNVSVLVTGESGTGKELVSRAIHRHSARSDKPFITVNLASLSPTLIESELFGHVRGAFTGADAARRGLLELADGGTVFFDEIGDVPLDVQVKLLRVLEQREITPVGDARARPADFRVIAATNRDLHEILREGAFRQDLYFRLAGFEISLPPLRERPEDIPLLAEHFLSLVRSGNNTATGISKSAMTELTRRRWPGNVRELRGAVQHAALLARGQLLDREHLPAPRDLNVLTGSDLNGAVQRAVREWTIAQLEAEGPKENLHQKILDQIEPILFGAVLEKTLQNRAAAADILGLHRATLRKKLN
ncbi:MAG TPA: sigma-54 dependent transcriptional regulator [Pirellulales bacterium]|jgi:two-component system nitrogen regulation response regulator GlnG|nr:sigma-54 dependent transcriptional regulator [Pirellulales bacterium]